MRRGTFLALASLLVAAPAHSLPSRSQAKTYTIRAGAQIVRQIGSFDTRRDPTIAAATRTFGAPSSRSLRAAYWCRVTWRRLELTIDFMNFGGHGPGETTCTDTVGKAQSFVVKSRRFRTWKGLRVGVGADRIQELHPPAEFRQGRWWLRTAVSPFGDQSEYAVISADVGGRRRVKELDGWIGAAGE
ncbi:MAG TPA: hypothetical protein VN213_05690 [Solirubrobacteraceae bacterium]|nr:hypothetical protein [Solirubrobacteraceae bacterium]